MLPLLFTQAARAELIDAQDWYEREAVGLGRRFLMEIDNAARRIAVAPLQFPLVFRTLRRARVRKFPYVLFFQIETDAIFVVACFHSSRDPRKWRSRA